MNNWKDATIDANGIRIHYVQTGGDKPKVVLNHGATDDGLCWTRVAKELESDYDVLMFDARGHGFSDSGQGDYTSEARANDLAAAIKTINLDRPVVGGHSMGADVSIHLAAIYPGLTRGIFMEDPPVTMPGEPIFGGEMGEKYSDAGKMMANIMSVFKFFPRFITKPFAKKMMPGSPEDEIIPWLNSKKRLSSDFLNTLRHSPDVIPASPFNELRKIKAPAMLIMGDRELGSIVSEASAQEMLKAIPHLKVVHLRGASHDIRRAKFTLYMKAIKSFLAEIYN